MTRTEYLSVCIFLLLTGFSDGKNVLFITIDDLRPDLGCYSGNDFPSTNDSPIISPNIDSLARRSLLLKRAYVQQAICSPSRTSFLTGRRPDTTKVYDLKTYFRNSGGNFTTLPQYFKDNGYVTLGYGKIFHPGSASGDDDPISWTEPFVKPKHSKWEGRLKAWRFLTQDEINEEALPDMKIAKHAIDALQQFATGGKHENKPFFLAVGFKKPHLPFVCPVSFRNNYPLRSIKIPSNPYAPDQMPEVAWSDSNELRHYFDMKQLNFSGNINETLPTDVIQELRQAYFSSVSFVDSLVGDVLRELEILGFENDTIISLLGDHGWHLGEHGIWAKKTNFEVATHAPLMIHVPGVTDAGLVSEHIAEFVDLFPTLVDAAELPKLSTCPLDSTYVPVCTEGDSLFPLMHNPNLHWKKAAFSQFPRNMTTLDVMGYSIRTDSYRYTEWVKFDNNTLRGDWTNISGVELYDHTKDPDENMNHGYDAAYVSLRDTLRQQLRAGWRTARPSIIG